MGRVLSFCMCLVIVLTTSYVAKAQQDSRVLSLYDRQSYEYIKQLQDRGYLLELHPTDMPYRYDELEPVPDFVLSGVVQESLRAGLEWVYYSSAEQGWKKGWWVRGDLGLNVMRNIRNMEGNDQTRLVGVIELGVQFDFSLID